MQADLYQRELRLQEDEIYRLEDYIEEYQAIISGYRCEVADLKRELAEAQDAAPAATPAPAARPTDDGPSLLRTPEPTDFAPAPAEELPAGEEEAPPFNPGGQSDPSSLDAAPLFDGASHQTDHATQLADAPRERAPLRQASAVVSRDPRRIDAPPNPYPTATAKRRPEVEPAPEAIGDPSIRLTAEPADEAVPSLVALIESPEGDALRRFDGEVSVMLTDPSEDGRTKRIARWDFSAAEVRAAREADTHRLALTIALPEATPTDRPLRLWVRLVERNGQRRLQATSVRFLAPPLRLVENESLAAEGMLLRLPAPDGAPASGAAIVHTEQGRWRSSSPERRIDTAVAPASYEAW